MCMNQNIDSKHISTLYAFMHFNVDFLLFNSCYVSDLWEHVLQTGYVCLVIAVKDSELICIL